MRWQGEPFGNGDTPEGAQRPHRAVEGPPVRVVRLQLRDALEQRQRRPDHRDPPLRGQRAAASRPTCRSLQVTPENLLTRLGNALGLGDIELESEDFNRRFRVHANDPQVRLRRAHPADDAAAAGPAGTAPGGIEGTDIAVLGRAASTSPPSVLARLPRCTTSSTASRRSSGTTTGTTRSASSGRHAHDRGSGSSSASSSLLALRWSSSYNRFVRQRNLVQESWRQIDVELQPAARPDPQPGRDGQGLRRARARPSARRVDRARGAAAAAPGSGAGRAGAAGERARPARCAGLFAVAEAYPDLKASTNFLAAAARSWPRPRTASPPAAASTTATCARSTRASRRSRRRSSPARSASARPSTSRPTTRRFARLSPSTSPR